MLNQPATRRLLYFSPFASGGLGDYAQAQATALSEAGVDIVFLTSRHNEILPDGKCTIRKELCSAEGSGFPNSVLPRKVAQARAIVNNYWQLARMVQRERVQRVLLASYAEYLAPLWVNPLRRLADEGVVFGEIVHDPVRDYVVGPKWWHRWSVGAAYSFLREAFVHEAIELDTGRPMPRLRTTVIPHGPYRFPPPQSSREQVRAA